MALEPIARKFIDSLGGPPTRQLTPEAAHQGLTDLQSQSVELQPALPGEAMGALRRPQRDPVTKEAKVPCKLGGQRARTADHDDLHRRLLAGPEAASVLRRARPSRSSDCSDGPAGSRDQFQPVGERLLELQPRILLEFVSNMVVVPLKSA